jgi:hypothetical protein
VTLFICTREGETSRLTDEGAGGTTPRLRAGADRDWSRETLVDAGAITLEFEVGAARDRSRETSGAGAMMLVFSDGAMSVCSEWTVGAGGTTAAFRAGAVRDLSAEMFGAGGTIELGSRTRPARDWSRARLSWAGGITLVGRLGATSEECRPSAGGGPGWDLKASRLATAMEEAGSLRSGASTTCGVSDAPRAT